MVIDKNEDYLYQTCLGEICGFKRKKPKWKGVTKYNQETAIDLMDNSHILRIVLDRKDDIIKVITFHIGRRGKYESAL